MRNKLALKRWVEEQPDRIYTMSRGEEGFLEWLEQRRKGRPMTLEIGMGTGDFINQLAPQHPERFFLGLEVKGDRVFRAFERWQEQKSENLAFLLSYAQLLLEYGVKDIDELYILFPDPWPKDRHEKHRLTFHRFLDLYRELLSEGGLFHFKTDDAPLFAYSVESLRQYGWEIVEIDEDYQSPEELCTSYERKFRKRGKPIHYLKARPVV